MNRLTELHLHIDGSIRPSTVWDLAHKQNMVLTVPNPAALEKELIVPDNCTALTQYLERFTLPLQVLQEADAITRVTYELAEDLAAENITCAELRFAPGSCTRKGLFQEEAVEAPREDRRGRRPGDRAGKPGARRNNGRRNDKQQQARKPAAKDGE